MKTPIDFIQTYFKDLRYVEFHMGSMIYYWKFTNTTTLKNSTKKEYYVDRRTIEVVFNEEIFNLHKQNDINCLLINEKTGKIISIFFPDCPEEFLFFKKLNHRLVQRSE